MSEKGNNESGAETTTLMEEVEKMHKGGEFDLHFQLQPLIHYIQDILTTIMFPLVQSKDSRLPQLRQDLGVHRWIIGQLTWKIRCNFHDKENAWDTILDLFACLENYLWEEKSLLVLCAFALSYVDFWRLAVEPLHRGPLDEELFYFMHPPCLDQATEMTLKSSHFEVVNKVVKYMLEIANSMRQLSLLKNEETNSSIQNVLKVASFMIVRSVVACNSYIMAFIKTCNGDGIAATEISDIESTLEHVITIHDQVREYGYQIFVTYVEKGPNVVNFEKFHTENSSVALKGKVVEWDEVVKGKITVAFLISDVDINENEYSLLKTDYATVKDSRDQEIVWIPMADQLNVTQQKASAFLTDEIRGALQRGSSSMPWYSLTQPAMNGEFRVRYIRENWKFEREPLLIVFQGTKITYHGELSMFEYLWPRIRVRTLAAVKSKLKEYPNTTFGLPQDPPQHKDGHEKAPKKDGSKSKKAPKKGDGSKSLQEMTMRKDK